VFSRLPCQRHAEPPTADLPDRRPSTSPTARIVRLLDSVSPRSTSPIQEKRCRRSGRIPVADPAGTLQLIWEGPFPDPVGPIVDPQASGWCWCLPPIHRTDGRRRGLSPVAPTCRVSSPGRSEIALSRSVSVCLGLVSGLALVRDLGLVLVLISGHRGRRRVRSVVEPRKGAGPATSNADPALGYRGAPSPARQGCQPTSSVSLTPVPDARSDAHTASNVAPCSVSQHSGTTAKPPARRPACSGSPTVTVYTRDRTIE